MYHMIVNPASKSGRGAKIWAILEPVLKERDIPYKVFFSQKAGHVIKLVRDLDASIIKPHLDRTLKLIVLGGDGTLNECLQGISDFSRVQIGYIPTGSSNDMARDLKLPKNPIVILDHILACKNSTPVDIGCLYYNDSNGQISRQAGDEFIQKRYFAVSAGIGFDAAVCEEALSSTVKNTLNKIGLGKLIYLAIGLKQLVAAKKVSCELYLDGQTTVQYAEFLFVSGMIHKYEGGGFKFCPNADYTDGAIDFCVIGKISKPFMLLALPTAFFGKHYLFKGIEHYRANKITIRTSIPLWVHTDGEVSTKSTSITLTCQKEQLQLLL